MPKSYTDEAMSSAIADVKNNQMSIRKASKKYNVPKSSLSDRLTGKVQVSSKWGRRPLFSDQDEKEMRRIGPSVALVSANQISFASLEQWPILKV